MTLSREFDFRNVSPPITLQYWTWYDIEKDYDYLYLTASTDGVNWKIINTPKCTYSNPTGANFGCGYSGKSSGWVLEKVDLSAYSGRKVYLKFDYITDLAVNGDGFVLDDISIPAIGYQTDFETDQGGWAGNGFVRIQNELPQEFLITYVKTGASIEVKPLFVDKNGSLTMVIPKENDDRKNYLIISGLTRFTIIPANYEIKLVPE